MWFLDTSMVRSWILLKRIRTSKLRHVANSLDFRDAIGAQPQSLESRVRLQILDPAKPLEVEIEPIVQLRSFVAIILQSRRPHGLRCHDRSPRRVHAALEQRLLMLPILQPISKVLHIGVHGCWRHCRVAGLCEAVARKQNKREVGGEKFSQEV